MRATILICLAAATLSGCGLGSSRLNPFNWFDGGSQPVTRTVAAPAEPLAQQVTRLEVAPTPGGVIVTATALPPTQGFFDAELVRRPAPQAGTVLLEFRLRPPPTPRPVGTAASREVVAGTFLTTQELGGAGTIAVQGATNRRTVRRR